MLNLLLHIYSLTHPLECCFFGGSLRRLLPGYFYGSEQRLNDVLPPSECLHLNWLKFFIMIIGPVNLQPFFPYYLYLVCYQSCLFLSHKKNEDPFHVLTRGAEMILFHHFLVIEGLSDDLGVLRPAKITPSEYPI